MRRGTQTRLERYSDVAKNEHENALALDRINKAALEKSSRQSGVEVSLDDPIISLSETAEIIDREILHASKEARTPKEIQQAIYDIQKEKQAIMDRLHKTFKKIDDPACEWDSKFGRSISYRDGLYFWMDETRNPPKERSATFGQIITDLSFGQRFVLNTASMPRSHKKRFFIELAKEKLRDLRDKQIDLEERYYKERIGGSERPFGMSPTQRERVYHQERVSVEDSGFIAEQVVQNFFAELQIDASLPVHIHPSDLYQDVVEKIDFIIRRTNHRRGVDVEGQPMESAGIQFTISKKKIRSKASQVERARRLMHAEDRVDDILLVYISLGDVCADWARWNSEGRPPGGPQQYWNREMRGKVFRGVLKGMMPAEEIEELWKRVVECKRELQRRQNTAKKEFEIRS